jgi:hypothetical protein
MLTATREINLLLLKQTAAHVRMNEGQSYRVSPVMLLGDGLGWERHKSPTRRFMRSLFPLTWPSLGVPSSAYKIQDKYGK